jgi:hypothetical protein
MCSTGRSFGAPIDPITLNRIVLPAALALAILAGPVADQAYAQGSRVPGAMHGSRVNVGFAPRNNGPLVQQGGRPNLTSVAVTGSTGRVINPNGQGVSRIPSGSNARPRRPHPPGPIITTRTIPLTPIIPVAVNRTGRPSTVTPLNGSGSGPSNQIVRRPGSGVPPAYARNYVPYEVLVELAAGTADQTAENLARRYRLTSVESFDFQLGGTKLYRWQLTDHRRDVPSVVRVLERVPGVISASANIISRLQQGPETVGAGNPNRTPLEQYAFAKLQLPQAHALALGDRVLIAIIDGGVDTSHPELAGTIVETFDAIGSGDPVHPHGTAVAGAIAAQVRIKGTAPAAQILAARAFGNDRASAEGTGYNIVKAINWAVSRNARIINLSFAGDRDPMVEIALRAARERGIVLVAAAGNDGPSSLPRYPAAYTNVIAVTATDQADQLFSAAVRGKHIAVAAPGVDLLLPGPDGTYRQISGTSFSAAEVSGTVALMLERQPNLDPETVRRTLMSTARDLGPRGVDPQFGAGLIDAYKALMAVSPQTVSSDTRALR